MTAEKVKPFLDIQFEGQKYYFQQDNASIHRSKETMSWFTDNGMDVIPWPALSHDLNVMENVWAFLQDIVYDGPQFDSKDKLWTAILDAAEKVQTEMRAPVSKLFERFNCRLLQVIEKKGQVIPY